jgi:heat shock protein HtpX
MPRSRFISDRGLTARMTLTMFLLGALFVVLVVSVALIVGQAAGSGAAVLIGLAGIGIAFYQWWSSDKVAMRAMRAREVTPEQAPELHGMIDRLCALADMPKPRVGVADMAVPNAFATGRSPDRSVVCVTTGILQTLTAEELEGVLAHELSHVAHRDVLVMTLASSAGIAAGLLMRFGTSVRMGGNGKNQAGALAVMMVTLLVSVVVYAVSFLLLRILSRYRELCADRAGAYLTMRPAALASALQKISGEAAAIPDRDLRSVPAAASALCIAPAFSSKDLGSLFSTHPPLEKRLEQLARIQVELGRPNN